MLQIYFSITSTKTTGMILSGIPPHIDTHSAFEDGIVALSLGSQVRIEL